MEGNLPPIDLHNAPPVMPSHKVGKYVMVNVVLLTKQLMEKEWDT